MGFFDSLKEGWDDFTSKVSDIASSAVETFKPAVQYVADKAEGAASWSGSQIGKLYDSGSRFVDNIGMGAGNLLTGAGNGIDGLGNGLGNALPYMAIAAGVIAQ